MTATAPTRPRLDPLIDAPLVGPRVLQLVGDESGCSMWRSWQPVAHLRLMGYPADWERVHNPWLIDVPLETYGALVLCRLSWPAWTRGRAERWMRTMKKGGRRLLFEADDDLFTPFMVDQQLGRVRAEKTRAELESDRDASLWVLARCDGVTVSTQYLASTVRRFTDAPVEVVPNAIDDEWFTKTQKGVPRPVPGPTIGWAGGNRPDRDLAQMAKAWGRIASDRPDVTFVVMGHQPPVISEHVPEGRIHRVPWMEAEQYPRGMVGIDIGCCPLDDHPFNRSKTPIKAWEYALSGAAVVASPTVYGKVIDIGKTGYLPTSVDWWEHDLARLLEDASHRREVAAALRRDVLARWTLRKSYWRWPAAWNRLMGGG